MGYPRDQSWGDSGSSLSDVRFVITCSACGQKILQPLAWLESQDEFVCRFCDARFAAHGDEIRQARQALEKVINGIGRNPL